MLAADTTAILTAVSGVFTTALILVYKSNRQYTDARISDLDLRLTSSLADIKSQLQDIQSELNRITPAPELLRQLQELNRNGLRDRQQLNNRLSRVEAMIDEINNRLARIESVIIRKGLSSRGDNHA